MTVYLNAMERNRTVKISTRPYDYDFIDYDHYELFTVNNGIRFLWLFLFTIFTENSNITHANGIAHVTFLECTRKITFT